jgi:hypothetical protein
MSQIVVTDLTRFANRDIVCVAGLDRQSGACVRPMKEASPHYLPFAFVRDNQIQPGSVLESDFRNLNGLAPHTEDSRCGEIRVLPPLSSEEFSAALGASAVETVAEGFGSNPQGRLYALNAPPLVSIITLRISHPQDQLRIVSDGYNKNKIRAHVKDESGLELSWLPISDLGFADHVINIKQQDPNLEQLNQFIHEQDFLFVRIGLTREYKEPKGRIGYWVQANGIYTFPNYRTDLRQYD